MLYRVISQILKDHVRYCPGDTIELDNQTAAKISHAIVAIPADPEPISYIKPIETETISAVPFDYISEAEAENKPEILPEPAALIEPILSGKIEAKAEPDTNIMKAAPKKWRKG